MPLTPEPGRRRYAASSPEAARAFLEEAYGSRLRMCAPAPPGAPYRLVHTDTGAFAGGEVDLPGRLHITSGPPGRLVVAVVRAGRAELRDGPDAYRLAAGQVFLGGRFGSARTARTEDIRLRTVAVPWALVRAAARQAGPLPAGGAVRFTGLLPLDAARADTWQRTAEFVHSTLLVPEAAASPLVLGESARLLAATALSVFPNNALGCLEGPPRPRDGRDATSDTLRRAIAFIESNAGTDIGLAEIAAAVPVTPRALQYAFARHADTTPLGYLRRVRLAHVHAELRAAEPGDGLTVTAIAARWGFAHAGRFASAYRQAYGTTPSHTFRTRSPAH
ncbi:helix-turn-helix transcriptional regulator [Streptomyces globosus]|uniref:helix-turn-helix transcriptional regulator n=1 Tax=Streptomyces globosus TaxID=68209 RepID=UPI0038042469